MKSKLLAGAAMSAALGVVIGLLVVNVSDGMAHKSQRPDPTQLFEKDISVTTHGTRPTQPGYIPMIIPNGRRAPVRLTRSQVEARQAIVADRLSDMGTRIRPEEVVGDFESQQKEFCTAFNAADFHPQSRFDHFQWCVQKGLVVRGWNGYISAFTSDGNGGWLAELTVFPNIAREEGGLVATPDKCIEKWAYRNGALTLIPTPHEHDKHGVIYLD